MSIVTGARVTRPVGVIGMVTEDRTNFVGKYLVFPNTF